MEKNNPIIETIVKHSDKLTDLAANVGVAYVGSLAMNHWSGALVGILGLKLAKAPNLAAGAAGVTILTALGVTQWVKPWIFQQIEAAQQAGANQPSVPYNR